MRLSKTAVVLLLSCLVILAGCRRKEVSEEAFYPLGGMPFLVKAYDVPTALFEEAFEEVKTETERLEGLFSSYIEDSELRRLNQDGRAEVSAEMAALLSLASRLSAESAGAFDISVGPLLDLWRMCGTEGRLPSTGEVEQRLALVDWRQVAVSSNGTVTLGQPNMALNLGGVAKGFIADRAARIMKKKGVRRGIIDAGGDLVLFNAVGEEPFRVGLKHPERPDVKLAVLEVDSAAVVTSGCYERYVEIAGKRVCHIVDPRSGMPVEGLLSTTIVAEEAASADALATAVMVLGLEKGQALVRSLPGVEGLLVWKEGEKLAWWISEGLQGKVKMSE